MVIAAIVSRGQLVTTYDSFRDMAYTHGILRGELGRDPTLPGLSAWYTPLQPLLKATISRLTGASVLAVHGTSLFWFGWLVPVSLFLLLRRTFGRGAAWWSLATIGLGSYWWLTHALMPIPSIEGIAPGALTLWAWRVVRERGPTDALGVGVLAGLAFAFHPICGAMALMAILLDGVLGPAFARGEAAPTARRAARQALVAFSAGSALSAAVLWPILQGPILNPAPRHWFAPELRDPLYALHAHAPLVPLLGLAGVVRAVATWDRAGWLVSYAAVALVGTLAGYAAVLLGWPIPFVIPHEFQWHLQLAWCVAAALALIDLGRHAARRWRWGPSGERALQICGFALVLAPALARIPKAAVQLQVLDRSWTPLRTLAMELADRGAVGSILACEPELAYRLSGLVGMRALLVPEGHMNPRADAAARLEALRRLLQAETEPAFGDALRHAPVDLVLHVPADSSQLRRLQQRYAGWALLEAVPLATTTLLLYSVRDDSSRVGDRPR